MDENELDRIIADFHRAEGADGITTAEWVRRYPTYATELQEYFNDLEEVNRSVGRSNWRDGQVSIGEVIGRRFRVREIRTGGMATVFIADDLEYKKHNTPSIVALKSIPPFNVWKVLRRRGLRTTAAESYGYLRARFESEVECSTQIGPHPNILRAYGVLDLDGHPFLQLEYADGGSLDQWIMKNGLTTALAISIGIQVCKGMNFAHQTCNLVHHDLKPSNILLQGEQVAKIADFGLSRSLHVMRDVGASESTVDGTCIVPQHRPDNPWQPAGTSAYMAPEQFSDLMRTDHRSDIFSFGTMFFELLTGHQPFAVKSAREMAKDKAKLRPVHDLNPDVPVQVSRIVARCLEFDAVNRFPQFYDILCAFERTIGAVTGVGGLR